MSGFSVKKASVPARLLLLCSPQWPVLLTCPHPVGHRGSPSSWPLCCPGRGAAQPQPCRHSSAATWKAEVLIPGQALCWQVFHGMCLSAGQGKRFPWCLLKPKITWNSQGVWHCSQLFMARGTNGLSAQETTNGCIGRTQIRYAYLSVGDSIGYCLQRERTEEMFLISAFLLLGHLYLSPVPVAPVSKKARCVRWKHPCISFCFLTLFCSEIMSIIHC